MGAPLCGCDSGPTLECATKCSHVGITECGSDPGYGHGAVFQQLARHHVTDFIEFPAKARAFFPEPAVKCALVHAQLPGEVIDRAFAIGQQLAQVLKEH